jgi:hypothetical protein
LENFIRILGDMNLRKFQAMSLPCKSISVQNKVKYLQQNAIKDLNSEIRFKVSGRPIPFLAFFPHHGK